MNIPSWFWVVLVVIVIVLLVGGSCSLGSLHFEGG